MGARRGARRRLEEKGRLAASKPREEKMEERKYTKDIILRAQNLSWRPILLSF